MRKARLGRLEEIRRGGWRHSAEEKRISACAREVAREKHGRRPDRPGLVTRVRFGDTGSGLVGSTNVGRKLG